MPDAFWSAIQTGTGSSSGILEAELGGDHHSPFEGFEGFSNQVLVVTRTINLGGIEEAYATLNCRS